RLVRPRVDLQRALELPDSVIEAALLIVNSAQHVRRLYITGVLVEQADEGVLGVIEFSHQIFDIASQLEGRGLDRIRLQHESYLLARFVEALCHEVGIGESQPAGHRTRLALEKLLRGPD